MKNIGAEITNGMNLKNQPGTNIGIPISFRIQNLLQSMIVAADVLTDRILLLGKDPPGINLHGINGNHGHRLLVLDKTLTDFTHGIIRTKKRGKNIEPVENSLTEQQQIQTHVGGKESANAKNASVQSTFPVLLHINASVFWSVKLSKISVERLCLKMKGLPLQLQHIWSLEHHNLQHHLRTMMKCICDFDMNATLPSYHILSNFVFM